MEKDMTVGNPTTIILQFTIPVFLGNLFQQLYSMVDTIIVGKCVGTDALAAVGSTGTIMFLIQGVLLGLTSGFTVLTSHRFGAGDMRGMRQTVGSAAILAAVITVLMTAVTMIGMRPLLIFMNTPDNIFADAYAYIMIICAGVAAQMLYNLLASILRAIGNSRTPLCFLVLSAGLNVALDLLLIQSFHLGVRGAAWATIISQGISGLLCLVYIVKKVPLLHLTRDDWRWNGQLAGNQLRVGIPMALQFSITAVGTMMVQAALNILGSVAVAGFTAANKVEQLVTQAFTAMGVTMATYCAQNAGAGQTARLREGFRKGNLISVIYAVVTGLVLAFAGKYMAVFFVSENLSEITGYVDIYVKCAATFLIPLGFLNVYRYGMQGMGYGFLPMMAGVAELAGRAIVAVIAAHYKSFFGICMANPVAWVFAAVLLYIEYRYIMGNYAKSVGVVI